MRNYFFNREIHWIKCSLSGRPLDDSLLKSSTGTVSGVFSGINIASCCLLASKCLSSSSEVIWPSWFFVDNCIGNEVDLVNILVVFVLLQIGWDEDANKPGSILIIGADNGTWVDGVDEDGIEIVIDEVDATIGNVNLGFPAFAPLDLVVWFAGFFFLLELVFGWDSLLLFSFAFFLKIKN